MQRYDIAPIQAQMTPEGFIRDAPVVGRTGLLKYMNADGTVRIEYRPPEEAFDEASLASLKGKPITIGHKAMVSAGNAAKVAPVGTVLSEGRADGEAIRADIVIYDLPTKDRELSCGYTVELDETPGVTPSGEHYDAVQRHIRYNHVAVVRRGRAGVARLNMDGDEVISHKEEKEMVKIKLDNGIAYDVPPEVEAAVKAMREDAARQKDDMDALQAKLDSAEAQVKDLTAAAEKLKEEQKKHFDAAVSARVALLDAARAAGVEKADGMSDMEIRKAVIGKTSKVNLDGKSDAYIMAAYDIALADSESRKAKMDEQNKALKQLAGRETHEDSIEELQKKLVEAEASAYLKAVK